MTVPFGEADKHALKKLQLFAIITLVGSIVTASFLALEYSLFPKLFSLSGAWMTVEAPNRTTHLYADAILTEFVVTNALTVAAIFPLRSALGDLSKAGSSNFRTPRIMMLVMLICVLVTVAGRSWTPQTTSPIPHWFLSAIVFLLDVAAYGTIVGLIGGEALGIWRLGSQYNRNLFKAASVLLIFPVVQLLYLILIFADIPVPIGSLIITMDVIILLAQVVSPAMILVDLRRFSNSPIGSRH